MATTPNVYPIPQFHFSVKWGGARIGFTEVNGLDYTYEVIEYREGSSDDYSKIKMPGLVKHSNITLKRGIVEGDAEFNAWASSTVMNVPDRRNLTISLLDDTGQPVFSWLVKNCFPVSYKFTEMKADGNATAIETLELAHEGIIKL